MAQSILDQMLDKGLVREDETPEAKRAALRDARPVESEKELPQPFEAPARGVIVSSGSQSPMAVRHCADCGDPGTVTQGPTTYCHVVYWFCDDCAAYWQGQKS